MSNTESKELVNRPNPAITGRGISLGSMDDLARFAQMVSKSGLAPKGMESPEAVAIAVQMGLELGLTPMAALQNVAVINGRPGIYGDAALALVRASGLLLSYAQEWVGKADERKAVVTVQRRHCPVQVTEFSVADAKKAGLWGKSGPWSQYSDRMLLFRARGFALRDNFGDVLKGFRMTEELEDIPAEKPANAREVRKSFDLGPTKTEPVPNPARVADEERILAACEARGISFGQFAESAIGQGVIEVEGAASAWPEDYTDAAIAALASVIPNLMGGAKP